MNQQSHPNRAIELDHDRAFQRREWRIQRVGWIGWFLLLGAATTGLTGPGLLDQKRISTSDNQLAIEYDRFLHHHHERQLSIWCRPAGDGPVRLHVSQAFLDGVKLTRIVPEPTGREINEDGVTMIFDQASSGGRGKILLGFEAETFGWLSAEISMAGAEPLRFTQFVYP